MNLGATNAYTGSVSLSASGLPTGATATFSPASISSSGTSTLTITTTDSTPVGSSTLTVTGTSGPLTHKATMTLNVTDPPVFTLFASPGSFSLNPGGNATYIVSTTALNGFTGTVNLSVTSGLPVGAIASFNPTSSITPGVSSTLTVTTNGSTPVEARLSPSPAPVVP